ncbi:MAG: sigma-70 family RNA polymerase sigma factor [Planctomycetota bacterium]
MGDRDNRSERVSRLLLKHRAPLYGFIFSCLRNHSDSDDVLQDVALAVTQSIDALRNDEEFLPWSREIARRRVLAHFERSRRADAMPPELVDALYESSFRLETRVSLNERTIALRECLSDLSQHAQELIAKRYDGSVADVSDLASQIGRTRSATYGMLKRIRKALRDCVERKTRGLDGS